MQFVMKSLFLCAETSLKQAICKKKKKYEKSVRYEIIYTMKLPNFLFLHVKTYEKADEHENHVNERKTVSTVLRKFNLNVL